MESLLDDDRYTGKISCIVRLKELSPLESINSIPVQRKVQQTDVFGRENSAALREIIMRDDVKTHCSSKRRTVDEYRCGEPKGIQLLE